jgi:hypothetical protein
MATNNVTFPGTPYEGYEVNPVTGNPIDPQSGNDINTVTGRRIDPATGYDIHPSGLLIDTATGNVIDPESEEVINPVEDTNNPTNPDDPLQPGDLIIDEEPLNGPTRARIKIIPLREENMIHALAGELILNHLTGDVTVKTPDGIYASRTKELAQKIIGLEDVITNDLFTKAERDEIIESIYDGVNTKVEDLKAEVQSAIDAMNDELRSDYYNREETDQKFYDKDKVDQLITEMKNYSGVAAIIEKPVILKEERFELRHNTEKMDVTVKDKQTGNDIVLSQRQVFRLSEGTYEVGKNRLEVFVGDKTRLTAVSGGIIEIDSGKFAFQNNITVPEGESVEITAKYFEKVGFDGSDKIAIENAGGGVVVADEDEVPEDTAKGTLLFSPSTEGGDFKKISVKKEDGTWEEILISSDNVGVEDLEDKFASNVLSGVLKELAGQIEYTKSEVDSKVQTNTYDVRALEERVQDLASLLADNSRRDSDHIAQAEAKMSDLDSRVTALEKSDADNKLRLDDISARIGNIGTLVTDLLKFIEEGKFITPTPIEDKLDEFKIIDLSEITGDKVIDHTLGDEYTVVLSPEIGHSGLSTSIGEVYHVDKVNNQFTIENTGVNKDFILGVYVVEKDGETSSEGVLGGPTGRTILHTVGNTEYVVFAQHHDPEVPGSVGEVWASNLNNNSFTIANSGKDVTSKFDWVIFEKDLSVGEGNFGGEAGTIVHHPYSGELGVDYFVLVQPSENPQGELGHVYLEHNDLGSFKIYNTGAARTSFYFKIVTEADLIMT